LRLRLRAAAFAGGCLLAFALVLTGTPAPAQGPPPAFTSTDEKPKDLPDGPGREETFYACTACHNFKLVARKG